jgi:hypothetical protein
MKKREYRANILARARATGYKLNDLAALCRITRGMLNHIIYCRRDGCAEIWEALCRFLRADSDWLDERFPYVPGPNPHGFQVRGKDDSDDLQGVAAGKKREPIRSGRPLPYGCEDRRRRRSG